LNDKNYLKPSLLMIFLIAVFDLGTSQKTLAAQNQIPMYRVYNLHSGEHFYTKDTNEKKSLIDLGWQDEGIGWYSPSQGAPVYRLYSPSEGRHFYTLDSYERDNATTIGWVYEGIGWNSGGNIPLHRNWSSGNGHNYTTNKNESDMLNDKGWRYEGVAWYGNGVGVNTLPYTSSNSIIEKAISIGEALIPGSRFVYGAGRAAYDAQLKQFDCSAFVTYCFIQAGYDFGYPQSLANTSRLVYAGRPVSWSEKKRGDILLLSYPPADDGHAAIYLGDNKILHCAQSTPNGGIDINDLSQVCPTFGVTWNELFYRGPVRRLFD